MEIAFELLSLVTASVALVLLLSARGGRSIQPAVVTLYICIGFNVAETLTRRFLRIKATAESATIETVTIALVATALCYAIRAKREKNKPAPGGLGLAIMCMVWAVTMFALELSLGFILRRWGAL
ncbi:MAG: hypothetical protein QMD05_04140 [Candidatus Brocadiaceae bacterium]|nr:hypothetical protein [Candidatus Brocadiaceae bacterium]